MWEKYEGGMERGRKEEKKREEKKEGEREGGRKKGRNLHEGNQTTNLREAEPQTDVLSTCADGYWTIKTHFLFLNQKRRLMKCTLLWLCQGDLRLTKKMSC